ncbi:MAG: hypothetical protein LC108_07480 [Anaerolineales bacterium]|nr:hypothetical protein [Anaerolineales bacterium]
MNARLEEQLLKEHRRDIQNELKDIRLEKAALRAKTFQPNLFTRMMEKLGEWLILRGEKLVKQYESPARQCKPARRKSYAH